MAMECLGCAHDVNCNQNYLESLMKMGMICIGIKEGGCEVPTRVRKMEIKVFMKTY